MPPTHLAAPELPEWENTGRLAVRGGWGELGATSRMFCVSIQHVTYHAIGELGLKPGRLGRHDAASVGHGHQVVHGRWAEGEGNGDLSGVDAPLELAQPAAAANEVDALVGARIADAKNWLNQIF